MSSQFEVVGGPLPPLEAADALIYTRETVYNVACKHGLHATFAPRVNATKCTSLCPLQARAICAHIPIVAGNGQHVHISAHEGESHGAVCTSPSHLTRAEDASIKRVIDHLPAFCAFMLPTPQSCWRVQEDPQEAHMRAGGLTTRMRPYAFVERRTRAISR